MSARRRRAGGTPDDTNGQTVRWVLAVASLLWPIALGAALVDRLDDHPTIAGSAVYLAAGRICHQKSDRSFFLHGHQWPVCGRCAGLYLAAPAGAFWALASRRPSSMRHVRLLLAFSAVPTMVTMVAEWWGAPVTSMARAVAALPLGAALAAAIVAASAGTAPADRVH